VHPQVFVLRDDPFEQPHSQPARTLAPPQPQPHPLLPLDPPQPQLGIAVPPSGLTGRLSCSL